MCSSDLVIKVKFNPSTEEKTVDVDASVDFTSLKVVTVLVG